MRFLLLALLAPAALAQGPATPPPGVRPDAAALLDDVRYLASDYREGRGSESQGAVEARKFIEARFRTLGLLSYDQGYVQPFAFLGLRDSLSVIGANVVALVRGTVYPDSAIVLTAHYDHLGIRDGQIYNGADDNASGVAGLLAAAAYFVHNPPRRSIVFVALDAEERGFHGARAFVDRPPVPLSSLCLNVNLDMIARADNGSIVVAGTSHTPRLRPVVEAATRGLAGLNVLLGHDIAGSGSDDWTVQSDHVAFHRAGIPFLYFGVEDHPDYHQPSDDADKIVPETLASSVEAVIRTLLQVDAVQ